MTINHALLRLVGASDIASIQPVQELWSGYGSINRYQLIGGRHQSVIVKQVRFPKNESNHPRGWSGQRSHDRKVRSYWVEMNWYRDWASRCDRYCRVPVCLGIHREKGQFFYGIRRFRCRGVSS